MIYRCGDRDRHTTPIHSHFWGRGDTGREFMSPAKIFLRNTESSENVKFIGGFIHTRYILST